MKTLILVRHAKSSWKDESLSDLERSLNERGKRDAPRMAARLVERGIKPDLLLCSPAKRARKTATALIEAQKLADASIEYQDSIYAANPNELLALIHQQPDDVQTLMMVGHNPSFSELANLLTPRAPENLPTCGIAEIELDIAVWRDAGAGCGTLVCYDFPKNTGEPIRFSGCYG